MADSTPLLSQPNSVKSESTPPLEKHHPSLDSTIERCIGDFGWAQFLQALLVSSAWIFDAQQTFITVFTDAHPTWHCTTHQHGCNSISNICYLPKNSWAWDWPSHTSIISEWNLRVCCLHYHWLACIFFLHGLSSGWTSSCHTC
ncbi:hypothetical protein SO802_011034 [Lithocarpus litseifolius]|uniref:Uncharacterized protein n=1 Tax=Lithocarpus litseifolius TaxID=425828 RepID=A0AAW2DFW7_9ROSI